MCVVVDVFDAVCNVVCDVVCNVVCDVVCNLVCDFVWDGVYGVVGCGDFMLFGGTKRGQNLIM